MNMQQQKKQWKHYYLKQQKKFKEKELKKKKKKKLCQHQINITEKTEKVPFLPNTLSKTLFYMCSWNFIIIMLGTNKLAVFSLLHSILSSQWFRYSKRLRYTKSIFCWFHFLVSTVDYLVFFFFFFLRFVNLHAQNQQGMVDKRSAFVIRRWHFECRQ